MTGTSINTPTTVANVAPELNPNKVMAVASGLHSYGICLELPMRLSTTLTMSEI